MSASPIDLTLQRAEAHGVRPSGRGRWRMRGACHDARRTLSVSIAEGNDGAVLLHCFAGCPVERIAGVLGLELDDLFPPRPSTPGRGAAPTPRPFSARDLLAALAHELRVVWIVLADVAAGRELAEADRRRAGIARERCQALIEELMHAG